MRISGIHTYALQAMLEEKGFGWSQRVTGTRQAAICVISTDAGVQGLARRSTSAGRPRSWRRSWPTASGPCSSGRIRWTPR